ncbi:mechanosensitive ion channel family protein [Clostridium sp. DJ247]|uniref:mechanosensitive ion channel family protein n=1 Tax=Clostridium sp. DJ247 TaxID=2726188 RepID=UPI001625EEDF|nr:mechanosensitive ion channel family protein [Clostridium sp. DJ247]MBC2582217.1 mechanosensitive ion channel family protein [Clostridium sp. DJ247]
MESLRKMFNFRLDLDKGTMQVGNFDIQKQDVYNFGIILVKIIMVLLLMYVVIKLGNKAIERYVTKQKNFRISLDERKAKTAGAILKSILRYCVYFFGIVSIVETILGSNRIGLTFAGIGGVAVGFGAQSLVKDIINGFFILFEDQFSVGDYINIDDKGGIVESIELRVTKIRDFNGDLHVIPNGLITKVTNHSRGNIRISVDVDIEYDEDVDNTIEIISGICERFKNENECVKEGPNVLGVSALKEGSITIRVAGKVKPMTQWDTEMKLRKEIREGLKKANIRIPYPKMKIVKE